MRLQSGTTHLYHAFQLFVETLSTSGSSCVYNYMGVLHYMQLNALGES